MRTTLAFLQGAPSHYCLSGIDLEASLASLLAATVDHPIANAFPPPRIHLRAILRSLVKRAEADTSLLSDSSSADRLYELYTSVVIDDASDSVGFRSYYLPATRSFVSLSETTHTISNGSTGLRTWPAALFLVAYLQTNEYSLKGKRVVELGCGAGLVGIVSSLIGAACLTFTDMDPKALNTARENCSVNGLSGGSFSMLDWETVSDGELTNAVISIDADVIIASDVAYDPVIIRPFVRVLSAFLHRCRSHQSSWQPEALVATTRRSESTFELFKKELEDDGLLVETQNTCFSEMESMLDTYYFDEGRNIVLMRIRAA
ncbi:hypothetical protein HDU83_006695 [Entophlyctis luteolus]|nr:hypothetical protein HDU83_006695 [Entophlyctis luteolus]